MSNTLHLDESRFDESVREGLTLVDFWAEWCGPCRVVGPVVDRLADEFLGRVRVAKVDVDANPGLAQRFGVLSIPTLVIFEDGQEVDRVTGALPFEALAERLEGRLPAAP